MLWLCPHSKNECCSLAHGGNQCSDRRALCWGTPNKRSALAAVCHFTELVWLIVDRLVLHGQAFLFVFISFKSFRRWIIAFPPLESVTCRNSRWVKDTLWWVKDTSGWAIDTFGWVIDTKGWVKHTAYSQLSTRRCLLPTRGYQASPPSVLWCLLPTTTGLDWCLLPTGQGFLA